MRRVLSALREVVTTAVVQRAAAEEMRTELEARNLRRHLLCWREQTTEAIEVRHVTIDFARSLRQCSLGDETPQLASGGEGSSEVRFWIRRMKHCTQQLSTCLRLPQV